MGTRASVLSIIAVSLLPSLAFGQAVQWRTEDGGNGHWYEVRTSPTRIQWATARAEAIASGGDLACITSAAENQFVFHLTDITPGAWVQTEWHFGPWIGGHRSPAGSDNWVWVSGEPWNYSAWMPTVEGCGRAQPDSPTQDFAEFGNGCTGTKTPTWSDAETVEDVRSYVVEWTSNPQPAPCVDPLASGHGVLLDGASGYVSVPDSASLDFDQQMTMEMWINIDHLNPGQTNVAPRPLSKGDGANWNSDRSYEFSISPTGKPTAAFFGGTLGTYIELDPAGVSIQPGRWYHLAATLDGVLGVARLYVDGQQVVERTVSEGGGAFAGMHLTNSSRALEIGTTSAVNWTPTPYFPGKVDEVRLWNVTRSPAQIADSYRCEVASNSPGLAACYRFSEGSGSAAHDLTGNANHGSFVGGVQWISQAPVCKADLGRQGGLPGTDGQLDNNDFVIFIAYFFSQLPAADVGRQGGVEGPDGQFDNNDFVVFINQFFAGC